MTTQIAVRIPDDLVRFVDDEIAAGRARSRADLVSRALAREARRRRALEDIELMRQAGVTGYPDLDGIVDATARLPLGLE